MINDDPYFGIEISSLFHDSTSLSNACGKYKLCVFLSINIQSLMSKHEQLVLELDELKQKNVTIDAILQSKKHGMLSFQSSLALRASVSLFL